MDRPSSHTCKDVFGVKKENEEMCAERFQEN